MSMFRPIGFTTTDNLRYLDNLVSPKLIIYTVFVTIWNSLFKSFLHSAIIDLKAFWDGFLTRVVSVGLELYDWLSLMVLIALVLLYKGGRASASLRVSMLSSPLHGIDARPVIGEGFRRESATEMLSEAATELRAIFCLLLWCCSPA